MILALIAITQLALAAAAAPVAGDSLTTQAPVQANTAKLDSFRSFGGLFSLGGGTVRIVAILSPTCPRCQEGMDGIADIMRRYPTNRLRAYIGVEPMYEGDTVFAALRMAGRFVDRRVVYLWDPEKLLGRGYRPIVGIDPESDDIACHTYFLYDTEARFLDEVPAVPDMWMQQHEGLDGPPFNLAVFEARIVELLERLEDGKRVGQ